MPHQARSRRRRRTVALPGALLARVRAKLRGTSLDFGRYVQRLIGIDVRRNVLPPRPPGKEGPPPPPAAE